MPVIPSLSPPLLSGAPAWRSLGDVTLTLKQHLERGTPTGLPRPTVHDRSSKAHFHSYVIWWFNQSQLCACYSWAWRFLGRPVLVNISCSVRISDTLLLPIFAEERSKQATKDYMCRICSLSPLNSSSVSHSQHPSLSLSLTVWSLTLFRLAPRRGKKQAKRNLPQLMTAARHQLRRAMPASVPSCLPASYRSSPPPPTPQRSGIGSCNPQLCPPPTKKRTMISRRKKITKSHETFSS